MGTEARAGTPAGAGRLVYNMYRGMLKNYNERANEILETKPAGSVSEDRGIVDLVDSMARQLSSGQHMSSETSANGALPAPPPPPPPPPLGLGAVPAVRIKSEIGERREPPPCVQNAMMTKDKKPFTYTPGGLDLSQIRSPRMARRLTRNAMSEGVQTQTPPPPSGTPQPQEASVPPPPPPMMMQPPMRPQVLPMQPPPFLPAQPPKVMPPSPLVQPPKVMPAQSPPVQPSKVVQATSPPVQPPKAMQATSPPVQPPKTVQATSPPVASPPSPQPPVQQSLREPVKLHRQQQPTPPPFLQPKEAASPPQQREVVIVTQPVVREAPRERAPVTPVPAQVMHSAPSPPTPPSASVRPGTEAPRSQVGSIYVPPLSPEEVAQRSGSSTPATPATALNKAPTPWLTGRAAQQRPEPPSWARAGPPTAATPERVIPVQIEFTSTSPAAADADDRNRPQPQRPHLQMQRQPSLSQQQQQQYFQQQQQQYQQQQQQYQQQQQQYQQQQQQYQQQQQQYQQQQQKREHVVRVIPIQIEGRRPAGNDTSVESPAAGGPVQSPAFRVLERVTSRDEELHSQPAVEHPPTVGHAFQQAQARRDQREPEPRKYTGASIPSRSFQMLQAMVAPENCAADGPRADDLSGGACPGSAPDIAAPPCPVPPWGPEPLAYWPDPYWAYAHAAPPSDGGDSGAPDAGFWYAPPPPPPWDPYLAAAYWYGYWPPCTPHPPYASASDTDDYSSTDEMGRYGLGWSQPAPVPLPQPEQLPAADSEQPGLQAIRSVSDIHVYKEAAGPLPGRRTATDTERSTSASSASSSPSQSEDSSDDDEDEEEEDEDEEFEVSEGQPEDGVHVPHQLSVIFEESEASDAERRRRELSVATTASEDDSSATVAVQPADTDNDDNPDEWDGACETTVTVRLPLKLKFGKSTDVTEVVVGDSEVHSSGAASPRIPVPLLRRQRSDDTVENYETAESDTDTLATERKMLESSRATRGRNNNLAKGASDGETESDEDSADDNENDPCSMCDNIEVNGRHAGEEESDYDDNDSNEEGEDNANTAKERHYLISDVEDRHNSVGSLNEMICDDEKDENANETVKLIDNLIINESRTCAESTAAHVSVRQRVLAIEGQSALVCAGDEDIDSGVTSDVSRHTDTEPECASDGQRSRYQRAATHSRLYKLLQDECSRSDDDDEEAEGQEVRAADGAAEADRGPVLVAKRQLWLPLSGSDPESFSSSGVCSPASPTWAAREAGRAGPQHEDALSNTSEDGSPLDSCYSSDYRSYFGSWERAAARARCPRVRAPAEAPARVAAASPAPRRQAAGAS